MRTRVVVQMKTKSKKSDVTTFDLMKQTVVWLLGIGMGFLPQGNITVKISKSPPGRYLLYRYTAMIIVYTKIKITTRTLSFI